jgi:hypothetical protein
MINLITDALHLMSATAAYRDLRYEVSAVLQHGIRTALMSPSHHRQPFELQAHLERIVSRLLLVSAAMTLTYRHP